MFFDSVEIVMDKKESGRVKFLDFIEFKLYDIGEVNLDDNAQCVDTAILETGSGKKDTYPSVYLSEVWVRPVGGGVNSNLEALSPREFLARIAGISAIQWYDGNKERNTTIGVKAIRFYKNGKEYYLHKSALCYV